MNGLIVIPNQARSLKTRMEEGLGPFYRGRRRWPSSVEFLGLLFRPSFAAPQLNPGKVVLRSMNVCVLSYALVVVVGVRLLC